MHAEPASSAEIPSTHSNPKAVDTQAIEQDLRQIIGKKYSVIKQLGAGNEVFAFLVEYHKEQPYIAKSFTNIQTGVYIHANG